MRFFSLSRERIPLLITLAIVISLGAGYYFVYVPGNESDIKQWKFRSLENTGRNIQSKIQIGHKQLTTYLHSDKLVDSKGGLKDSVNIFLRSLYTENLPISPVTRLTSDVTAHDALIVTTIPRKLILTDTATRNGTNFRLSLTYDFDKFIKPLLTDQVFDQYLIVKNDTVLYETFFSGQTPCRDTLFTNCGKLNAATIVDREYAGIRYKLFILPVDLNAETRILLTGLLTADHYAQAKTRLPTRLVLFLITLFTCILVTFPIIKLYQLADEERLTLKDVVSVTIVSMLLMSLIFLCFVKYSSMFFEDKDGAKLNLAQAISSAFVKEIRGNYVKLDTLNNRIERDVKFRRDFYKLGKSIPVSERDTMELSFLDSTLRGIELDRIFWMDKDGVEIRTWTSGSRGFFPGRFDQRDYFKNTVSGRSYSIDSLANSKLYVDQIVSWISGDFLTVIAKPSRYNSAQVAAILFRPQSLKKTKIPPGYAFAVIDYNGRVLYHSDTTKNLNENLFDEFSDEKNLQSSIKTGAFQPFKTRYYGKEYHVQMRPVGGGLPYYVVILESLMFEEYRDTNVYSFTLAMQLLLFGLIIIQALAIFFASARPSNYKGRSFETGWLGPKTTSRKQYLFAGIFNILQFGILCTFFTDETVLSRLLMLLVSISLMPVFLNILFYDYYKKHEQKFLSEIKLRAIIVGLVFTIFLNFVAWAILVQSFLMLLSFELLAFILGFGLRYLHAPGAEGILSARILSYKRTYTFMLISWMLVSMGFSVILFFRAAYNYEQHLIARYTQLEFADANTGILIRKIRAGGDSILTDAAKQETIKNFYQDKYWVDSVWFSKGKPAIGKDDESAINLLRSFHLYSNENMPDRIHLNNPSAFDFSFYFNNLIRQAPTEKSASLTYYRVLGNNYLVIKSAALRFRLPSVLQLHGFFFWLVFAMILAAFSIIIFGLIRRIFSLNMSDVRRPEAFDLKDWLSENESRSIFLIDFDDRSFEEISSQMPEKPAILTLDLAEMAVDITGDILNEWNLKVEAVCKDGTKPLLLDHFEYNFKNVATSNGKMHLLEKLIRNNPQRKLLIRSTIHPTMLLLALSLSAEKDNTQQTAERWHSLLRVFKIVINPINDNYVPEYIAAYPHAKADTDIYDNYVSYYHKYFSIWQSLSDEEKFMLYDLAEDGLVNSYDKITFRQLISKGIVKPEFGRFKLFSKGFRSFILAGLSRTELSGIMAKINDNANWNRIRMPLILISLAILIFILSSQREASTKLLTTLGALATAIPALINLLSSVSGNSNKKTTN